LAWESSRLRVAQENGRLLGNAPPEKKRDEADKNGSDLFVFGGFSNLVVRAQKALRGKFIHKRE
jgi:hypothetical protein